VTGSFSYCVANMPGAVCHTSTYALTNVTLSCVLETADKGWRDALATGAVLASGLDTHDGQIIAVPMAVPVPVAEAHGPTSVSLEAVLA